MPSFTEIPLEIKPPQQPLRVGLCQMNSSDDWSSNREQALTLANQVLETGPVDLLCFPENSLYMRLIEGQPIPSISIEDPIFEPLADLAVKNSCYIYLGSLPLKLNGKTYNASVIMTPEGSRFSPYQKVHLFDIELEGQKPIRESDEFARGKEPAVVDIRGWKLGLSICYDLRFSELYSFYQKQEVDIIGIPAAFLVPTGQAHWHTLMRARAIESQCFVLAAAQGGDHKGFRQTYGHSLAVDPWGNVLADAQNGIKALRVELNPEIIRKVRRQIPMKSHRRL